MSRFRFSLRSLFFFSFAFALTVFIFITLPADLLWQSIVACAVIGGVLFIPVHFRWLDDPWRTLAVRLIHSLTGCELGAFFSVMAILIVHVYILNGKLDLFVVWGYGIRIGAGLGFLIGLLSPVRDAKAS